MLGTKDGPVILRIEQTMCKFYVKFLSMKSQTDPGIKSNFVNPHLSCGVVRRTAVIFDMKSRRFATFDSQRTRQMSGIFWIFSDGIFWIFSENLSIFAMFSIKYGNFLWRVGYATTFRAISWTWAWFWSQGMSEPFFVVMSDGVGEVYSISSVAAYIFTVAALFRKITDRSLQDFTWCPPRTTAPSTTNSSLQRNFYNRPCQNFRKFCL